MTWIFAALLLLGSLGAPSAFAKKAAKAEPEAMKAEEPEKASMQAAATKPLLPVGAVVGATGNVTVARGTDERIAALELGQPVYAGDRIVTGADGLLHLALRDGTQMKLSSGTKIELRDSNAKGEKSGRGIASVKISLGSLWAKVSKKNSKLEFETPSALAVVKGTEPQFDVSEDGDLCVKLKEGRLDLANDLGGSSLTELQQLCVKKGEKPGTPESWDGVSSDWLAGAGAPSDVILKVRDAEGNERDLKIEYQKK
ncbi:MAG: FecR family protein [candidate division FCPU426 bacterium]